MGENDGDPLPRGLDPEAAASEAGVAEGVGGDRLPARASGGLSCPAQSVGTFAGEGLGDRAPGEEPRRPQPLPAESEHLFRGHEQAGVPRQAAQRAYVAVLGNAAQERCLTGEAQSLLRGELDLSPVVEPAFDDRLRRRIPGERAERSQAQRGGNMRVE